MRCFEDDSIEHANQSIDPIEDANVIELELILSDLDLVAKLMHSKRVDAETKDILQRAHKQLSDNIYLYNSYSLSPEEKILLRKQSLLTARPMLYVANIGLDNSSAQRVMQLQKHAVKMDRAVIPICVEVEAALINSHNKDQDAELLGLNKSALSDLVHAAHKLLEMQTFYTAGPKESRGYIIPKIGSAYDAAGQIHTDFQDGFIRAELLSYENFITHGGWDGNRVLGNIQTVGRNHVLNDGDVLIIKHNR